MLAKLSALILVREVLNRLQGLSVWQEIAITHKRVIARRVFGHSGTNQTLGASLVWHVRDTKIVPCLCVDSVSKAGIVKVASGEVNSF